MRSGLTAVLILMTALALSACATAPRISSQPYGGADLGRYAFTFWNVVSIGGVAPSERVVVRIGEEELQFEQGCAGAKYPFDIRSHKLTIYPRWSWGGCIKEPAFLTPLDPAVKSISRIEFSGAQLELRDANKNPLAS